MVHGAGADLHLEDAPCFVVHGRVQRLIPIRFGLGDVIIKFFGDGFPHVVDNAQHLIAKAYFGAFDDDPYRVDIINFLDGHIFAHHFAVDGVEVLGTAADLGQNLRFGQPFANRLLVPLYQPILIHLVLAHKLIHHLVRLWLQKAKGQIL